MTPLNTTELTTQMRSLMDNCFWARSHYWTTQLPQQSRNKTKTVIKVAYLNKTECFAFIFSKYQAQAVQVFCSLAKNKRWFYTEPINQFKSFSAWCISAECFEAVRLKLQTLPDVELEFVIPQSKQGLSVPAPFEALGLQFYLTGSPL